MFKQATFACPNDCGKLYIPLAQIESHLKECAERAERCKVPDCVYVGKAEDMNEHQESAHPKKKPQ